MVLRSQNRLTHSRIRCPISSPAVCLALFGCCFQSCMTMVMRMTLEPTAHQLQSREVCASSPYIANVATGPPCFGSTFSLAPLLNSLGILLRWEHHVGNPTTPSPSEENNELQSQLQMFSRLMTCDPLPWKKQINQSHPPDPRTVICNPATSPNGQPCALGIH